MSADNLIRIKEKKNGLYQVRHESASSLAHALSDVEPTEEELLLEIIADNVKGRENAIRKAEEYSDDFHSKGGFIEYGIQFEGWEK